MTNTRRTLLYITAVLIFAAAWAFRPSALHARPQGGPQTTTTSGKISSVQKDVGPPYVDSFTLDVADPEKTWILFTFDGTMIQGGELKTNVNAEVDHAMDRNGNDVAIRIRIKP